MSEMQYRTHLAVVAGLGAALAFGAVAAPTAALANEEVFDANAQVADDSTAATDDAEKGDAQVALGTSWETAFTTIDAYNNAVKDGAFDGKDVYLSLVGEEGKRTEFSDTLNLMNVQNSENPPKLHLKLANYTFAKKYDDTHVAYFTNTQELNVSNCTFKYDGSSGFAVDVNLCAIKDANILFDRCSFITSDRGGTALKVAQRKGETDKPGDIKTPTPATVQKLSVTNCSFDGAWASGLTLGTPQKGSDRVNYTTGAFPVSLDANEQMVVSEPYTMPSVIGIIGARTTLDAGVKIDKPADSAFTPKQTASIDGCAICVPIDEAVSLKENASIVMKQDASVQQVVNLAPGVKLDGNGKTITSTAEDDAIQMSSNTQLSHVTVDASGKQGIQTSNAKNVTLDGVTVNGGTMASLRVNGSQTSVKGCTFNPADGARTKVEYAMGEDAAEVPSIAFSNMNWQEDALREVFADQDTLHRVIGKEVTETISDYGPALAKVNENVTGLTGDETSLSLYTEGEKTHAQYNYANTPVTPPVDWPDESHKNPDGSVTDIYKDTKTNADGSVTETVREVTTGRPDGSSTEKITETTTDKDGNKTVKVTETNKLKNGTEATVVADGAGRVASAKAKVSAADAKGGATVLPLAGIAVLPEDEAPNIEIDLPPFVNANNPIDVSISLQSEVAPLAHEEDSVDSAFPGAVIATVGKDGAVSVLPKTGALKKDKLDGVQALLSGDCTIKVFDNAQTFPDIAKIDPDVWYVKGGVADFVSSRGILSGVVRNDGTSEFQGDVQTTRGMFVTMLHRLENEAAPTVPEGFEDVTDADWFQNAAAWGSEHKIVNGYGDGTIFGGNDKVTREQIAVFLMRYAQWLGQDTSARADITAPDAAEISDYAKDAVSWAVAEGYIKGSDITGELNPTDYATRAEAATVVMRFVNAMHA